MAISLGKLPWSVAVCISQADNLLPPPTHPTPTPLLKTPLPLPLPLDSTGRPGHGHRPILGFGTIRVFHPVLMRFLTDNSGVS